jgi:protein-disulfide isomerase
VAAVLVVVSAVALSACGGRATTRDGKVAYSGLEGVPEALAPDGTTIRVGDPEALVTLHLYEDPRCPFCEEFELTGGGPAAHDLTVRRSVRTDYTLASFLDDRLGGGGSKRAVNALRASLEEGKFAEYHAVLYKNQPEESVDGFTDAKLLDLAGQVKGLRGPAFDSAIKTMKYRDFVVRSQKAYESAGGDDPRGPGTPTAVINGIRVREEYAGILYDQYLFGGLLNEIERNPEAWTGF